MKHTQEPWEVYPDQDIYGAPYESEGFYNPLPMVCDANNLSAVDADRIVACVNACAGIEDPAAELARLRRVEELARLFLDDVGNSDVLIRRETYNLLLGDGDDESSLSALRSALEG